MTTYNAAGKSVTFYGGAGDDTLTASAGTDIFYGEAGDDTVSYSNSISAVTVDLLRNAGGGAAAGDSWFRVENVIGTNYNDNIRGNGDYNYIFGGAGNDVISGGAGGDNLDGGLGVDRLDYSRSDAAVTVNLATGEASGGHAEGDQFQGFESLEGSGYADRLTGDAGVNRLFGGYGADRLTGGGAGDSLYGGTGADRFIFTDVADSRSSSGRDVIYDFKRSEGDRIDLSGIDASISAGGNQAFSFIGTTAFSSGVQGQLNYRAFDGYLMVYGDINGDKVGDFSIQVLNVASLAASDFVL
ncbi:calcium-binding protein [Methylopila jiangsuensis]|uniref:calcium-binding protein n=1 Tax=Methylopila jiangsuensis TaxID=586230 RepID=UPI00286B0258|nr:calcium-binding protein [Methylopila jiangsuensis]